MNDPQQPAPARVDAAGQLLDRGHGRAHQSQDPTVHEQRAFVIAPKTASREEWLAICEANLTKN